MISPRDLAKLVKHTVESNTPEKPFVLATVDPNYINGRPRLLFDGEDTVSNKKYPYLSSYTPVANDRVIVTNINGMRVILGKII